MRNCASEVRVADLENNNAELGPSSDARPGFTSYSYGELVP